MPRTSSRRKAFQAAQLPLDLSGTCDLWLDDLAPAASVRPACSVTAPAGPVVGASLAGYSAAALFTSPCGLWLRKMRFVDASKACDWSMRFRTVAERRA